MELENISPESITPRPLNLGDSQDLLAETSNNLSSSKDGDDVEPNIIIKKKRKKIGRKLSKISCRNSNNKKTN